MSERDLPLILFRQRDMDNRKKEGHGSKELPRWVLRGNALEQRSRKLSSELTTFRHMLEKKEQAHSEIPFVFVVEACKDARAKSRRSLIADLLRTGRNDKIIGLRGDKELIVRLNSVEEMSQINNKLNDIESENYAISCIDGFRQYIPEIEKSSEVKNYKVVLLDHGDRNDRIQSLFETMLLDLDIKYRVTNYAENYRIYNLKNIGSIEIEAIEKDELFESVLSMTPMPRYSVSLDSLTPAHELEISYPDDGREYPTVGMLDTGISKIPHLKPWIKDRYSPYPDSLIDTSHGTAVAGIVEYGDELENKNWVDFKGIMLLDASIYPDTKKESIDEDELINNIGEAVSHNPDVMVWNLCLSTDETAEYDSFSDLAIALDEIQDRNNVLIVKSAGNSVDFAYGRPNSRIAAGADSVRALTVGSVAHDKSEYDLSEVGHLSPFSRVGPGPEYIIKPEISHYGGNCGENYDEHQTGVKSLTCDGKISSNIGTSFSTPRVSALAAGLQNELGHTADPLLLKALIIHSARYPEGSKDSDEDRVNSIGFGVPTGVWDILHSSQNEATLILRGKLSEKNKMEILDFPMPKCLIKDGYYCGRIKATLVYKTILDPHQGGDYCQSNINLKMGTYAEKRENEAGKKSRPNPINPFGSKNLFLKDTYSKKHASHDNEEFALKERVLIKYGDKYYPVKKYSLDLSEILDSYKKYLWGDRYWFLSMEGIYRDAATRGNDDPSKLDQEFCLIVTISDPEREVNVYDGTIQALNYHSFWHADIKTKNEITVHIDESDNR